MTPITTATQLPACWLWEYVGAVDAALAAYRVRWGAEPGRVWVMGLHVWVEVER